MISVAAIPINYTILKTAWAVFRGHRPTEIKATPRKLPRTGWVGDTWPAGGVIISEGSHLGQLTQ